MSTSFEVDRLEWVAPDRIEVAGRWFGVRGLRFVRPSLDLEAGDERRHLLAVLDHKPWEARDGEDWIAAFPWDGDKVELSRAELAVTPAVVVELPVADGAGEARPVRRAEPKPKKAAAARRLAANDRDDRARAEAQALRQERDAALAARDEAVGERDAALAARDAMAAEGDAALAARSAALGEVQAAMAHRDAAFRERDQTKQALKTSRETAKQATAARDELAQKHAALRARSEVSVAPPVVEDEHTSPWPVRAIAVGALVVLLAIFVAVLQGAF